MSDHFYLLIFFVLGASFSSFAQGFDCNNTAYLSTQSASGSSLYFLQVTETEKVHNLAPLFENNIEYQIGCIGYSVVDRMIYALDYNTHNLLQINALGEITNLGKPIGLDTTLRYQAGAVFPEGNDFFVVGRDENTQIDQAYFSINLKDLIALPVDFEGSINATIQDIAINPRDGAFFGYDSRSNKIVNIDFGVVSNFQFPQLPEIFTALFFDHTFNLYAYGERSLGLSQKFYAINKITSEVNFLQDGPLAFDSDACGCPYRFDFFKTMTPPVAIPCQEVIIEYSFHSASGTPRLGLGILDTLPEVLTITDIDLGNPFNKFDALVNSGIGSNILDLSNLHILLGDIHTIKVTAIVDEEASGTFTSQAVLKNLPLALNPAMRSDDLVTEERDDPNIFQVVDPTNPNFKDSINYNCEYTLATIYAPITDANSYLWSDGSTEATLEVTTAGTYNVVMETDCEPYSVDITVDFEQPAYFIDLGADQLVPIGETINLSFETNVPIIKNYDWRSDVAVNLSCLQCPNPTLRVIEPTTIQLILTDNQGCETVDELFIDVLATNKIYAPNVFSPNNDGINDIFYLQGTNATITHFQIFDRWGNLLFNRQNVAVNDATVGWEGDFQGTDIDMGVYFWSAQLQYLDGTEDVLSGTVGVIR